MHTQFIDKLKYRFKERLQIKTGWGRNDVFTEFENAINDALADIRTSSSDDTTEITGMSDAEFNERVLGVLERLHLIVRK